MRTALSFASLLVAAIAVVVSGLDHRTIRDDLLPNQLEQRDRLGVLELDKAKRDRDAIDWKAASTNLWLSPRPSPGFVTFGGSGSTAAIATFSTFGLR